MSDCQHICSYCQSTNTEKRLRPDTIHYAELRCLDCNRHRWLSKPKDEKTSKREPEHQDLVKKYSQGFCVICYRLEEDLPPPQKLVAHHVVEYQDGGESTPDNIQIVCTYCHQTIHTIRTYMGHYTKSKDLSDLIAACEVEMKRAGFTWRSERILNFCEAACGKRNRHFLKERHLKVLLKKLIDFPTQSTPNEEEAEPA